jgi:hypothetical protein
MKYSYLALFLIGFMLLSSSIMQENENPIFGLPNGTLYMWIFRYIHFVVFLFTSFYLLFFMGTGTETDKYLLLITILGVVSCWYIFGCCWLSYMELLFYNIELEKVKTTVNTTFMFSFDSWDRIVLNISGILYLLNVCVVLYSSTSLSLLFKIAYFAVFIGFFLQEIYTSNNKICYYNKNDNAQMEWLHNMHRICFTPAQ